MFLRPHGDGDAASKIGFRKWIIAFYLMWTSVKGTPSIKLLREIVVRQAVAWFMMRRIHEAFDEGEGPPFQGPVEVDECVVGGKEMNKHASKEPRMGRGYVGKIIVAGIRDRPTGRISAKVNETADKATLRAFVAERAATPRVPRLHGRVRRLSRSAVQTPDRQAQGRRVRQPGGRQHQLRRELLGCSEARLPRHIPQRLEEAPGSLCL